MYSLNFMGTQKTMFYCKFVRDRFPAIQYLFQRCLQTLFLFLDLFNSTEPPKVFALRRGLESQTALFLDSSP